MPESKDKHGQPVKVGSKVRLVELSPTFLDSLPQDEIDDVRSMIGDVLEVYEIDDYGCAWVEKGWHYTDQGQYMGHSIGLDFHEMELIDEDGHSGRSE